MKSEGPTKTIDCGLVKRHIILFGHFSLPLKVCTSKVLYTTLERRKKNKAINEYKR